VGEKIVTSKGEGGEQELVAEENRWRKDRKAFVQRCNNPQRLGGGEDIIDSGK